MAPRQRAKRGEGTVFQTKHGEWFARIPLGGGHVRKVQATDKADAERKRAALIAERDGTAAPAIVTLSPHELTALQDKLGTVRALLHEADMRIAEIETIVRPPDDTA